MRAVFQAVITISVLFTWGCPADAKTSSNGGAGNAAGQVDAGHSGSGMCTDTGIEYGKCTKAQVDDYNACFHSACASAFDTCYGPQFQQGKFAGPCADYLTCASKCKCEASCVSACVSSPQCQTCTKMFSTCAAACKDKRDICFPPASANGKDAGPSGSTNMDVKTCADLLVCCNTLTDAKKKKTCLTTQSEYAGKDYGASFCTLSYENYCP